LTIAVLAALVLTQSPARVVSARALGDFGIASTVGDATDCQTGEVLLAGVSALRVGLDGSPGPPVRVRGYVGSRVVLEGTRGAGWTGSSVTVPVKPLPRTVSGVRLCFQIAPNSEPVFLIGSQAPPSEDLAWQRGRLPGRLAVEELRSGHPSWWSLAGSVARHMGVGHVVSGSWPALLIAVLMASVAILATRAVLRELP